MKIGIAFIIFGIFIGGAGLASAGVGIAIPMIPIGIYLIVRGYKSDKNIKQFENTSLGKILLGVLLIIIGVGTSTMYIGIPIGLYGIYILLDGKSKIKKYL